MPRSSETHYNIKWLISAPDSTRCSSAAAGRMTQPLAFFEYSVCTFIANTSLLQRSIETIHKMYMLCIHKLNEQHNYNLIENFTVAYNVSRNYFVLSHLEQWKMILILLFYLSIVRNPCPHKAPCPRETENSYATIERRWEWQLCTAGTGPPDMMHGLHLRTPGLRRTRDYWLQGPITHLLEKGLPAIPQRPIMTVWSLKGVVSDNCTEQSLSVLCCLEKCLDCKTILAGMNFF